jgi:hypothetical protein
MDVLGGFILFGMIGLGCYFCLQFKGDHEMIKSNFCGFESGQDWLDDLALIRLLNKVEIPKIKINNMKTASLIIDFSCY